jgi:hypothetical protein
MKFPQLGPVHTPGTPSRNYLPAGAEGAWREADIKACRHCFKIASMRRSGTNHMSAIATYSTSAIHGLTNARGIATTYTAMDNLPFRSLPSATASVELWPLQATIAHWS